MSSEDAVASILRLVNNAWESSMVRVKQDGEMLFIPLNQVRDQKLAYKIVKQLFKQLGREYEVL